MRESRSRTGIEARFDFRRDDRSSTEGKAGSFFDRFPPLPLLGWERKEVLTVDVEVEPGTVLVGRPVEEHHLALVPSLVALADVGQVEAGPAVR